MQLADIIKEKIQKEGPVSFHDFMEMCLYYPRLGYYTSPKNKIGCNGDYYTSAYLSSVFGAMIARQLEEMWQISGKDIFTVVEYGAGIGYMTHDILDYIKSNNAGFYSKLNYCIIEKSPEMREKEEMHLSEKVSWYDSIERVYDLNGCVLSNELLDNFSVHRVAMHDELMEVYVDEKNGFTEVLKPASEELKEYLVELNIVLPKGFQTEINLEATEWLKEVSGTLKNGYVLTIDYGYESDELYSFQKRKGTLLCYNKHKVNDHPYCNVGEQDITTHVNFSALQHWGRKYGLYNCGFTDQAHFLLALGLEDHLRKIREKDKELDYRKEAFLIRTLLIDMGRKLKVLVQQKGIPVHKLTGLRLSKNRETVYV